MMGIIKMRIPAKANTIMTPRMISQKKRSMSILVGHSGLSARLTRIAATDVLCRWLLTGQNVADYTKTDKHIALSTEAADSRPGLGDETHGRT